MASLESSTHPGPVDCGRGVGSLEWSVGCGAGWGGAQGLVLWARGHGLHQAPRWQNGHRNGPGALQPVPQTDGSAAAGLLLGRLGRLPSLTPRTTPPGGWEPVLQPGSCGGGGHPHPLRCLDSPLSSHRPHPSSARAGAAPQLSPRGTQPQGPRHPTSGETCPCPPALDLTLPAAWVPGGQAGSEPQTHPALTQQPAGSRSLHANTQARGPGWASAQQPPWTPSMAGPHQLPAQVQAGAHRSPGCPQPPGLPLAPPKAGDGNPLTWYVSQRLVTAPKVP